MSAVDRFVRFRESDFELTEIDPEAVDVSHHIDSGDRILDVGCGIGSLEERFGYDVVGIDRSEPMGRTARRRSLRDRRRRALPVRTDSGYGVVLVATLEFIPVAEAAL